MSTFTYIYNIQGEVKLLDTLNYTLEEFKVNPKGCYPNWNTENMYASDTMYECPILIEGIIREMTKYEKYKKGLYELLENGEIKSKDKIEGTRVEWNWTTHEWEEKATNLEIVQAQYRDYEGMDTPSTLEEMKQQDPAIAEEYLNMMIELRGLIYTLSASEQQPVGYTAIQIPTPSESLKNFKNKFNLVR